MKRNKAIVRNVDPRRADSRDAEIGHRMRSRRLESGLSQTEFGSKIGVTFQQVQKYEKGANRIGSGRLQRAAEALDVPIAFFFDAPGPMNPSGKDASSVFAFMQDPGAVRIVKAFHRIKSRKARQVLVGLAEMLADGAAERG